VNGYILCLLAGCSRNTAVSPTNASLTFDAIAFNQKQQPHGWRAAIDIKVLDGRVYAQTSQDSQAFALLSYSADEVTSAVMELHEWEIRRERTTISSYNVNRIQYSLTIGGTGVSGLPAYQQIAELPESIQHLYRAALDQAVLHMLSK
jgi:hypothetical protein